MTENDTIPAPAAMPAAPDRLRSLARSHEPPELPPVSDELVRALDLPVDLPDELGIYKVTELTGVTAHTLRCYERIGLLTVGRDRNDGGSTMTKP